MVEQPQEKEKLPEEKAEHKEEKAGKEKHERLKQEHTIESQFKEKMKDFRRDMTKHGKHLFDRKRKDKFLGGAKREKRGLRYFKGWLKF